MRFKRSLYFVKDLKKGSLISPDNIRSIRPGFGIAPKNFNKIIGKKVNRDVFRGTAVKFSLIK